MLATYKQPGHLGSHTVIAVTHALPSSRETEVVHRVDPHAVRLRKAWLSIEFGVRIALLERFTVAGNLLLSN